MRSVYGRQTPPPDYELTCVEPGSPMELLRRYWQPVCSSDELRDLPKKVKLLSEELVIFRDKKGRVGALEPYCSHRGTSLEWGTIEEQGLRCCYHGCGTRGHIGVSNWNTPRCSSPVRAARVIMSRLHAAYAVYREIGSDSPRTQTTSHRGRMVTI
jgi:hypothetical protein